MFLRFAVFREYHGDHLLEQMEEFFELCRLNDLTHFSSPLTDGDVHTPRDVVELSKSNQIFPVIASRTPVVIPQAHERESTICGFSWSHIRHFGSVVLILFNMVTSVHLEVCLLIVVVNWQLIIMKWKSVIVKLNEKLLCFPNIIFIFVFFVLCRVFKIIYSPTNQPS